MNNNEFNKLMGIMGSVKTKLNNSSPELSTVEVYKLRESVEVFNQIPENNLLDEANIKKSYEMFETITNLRKK